MITDKNKFLNAVLDLCNNYGGPTAEDCKGEYAWVGDIWRTAERMLKAPSNELYNSPVGHVIVGTEDNTSSGCTECGGTGLRDLGGFHPWGEPTMVECDCGEIHSNEEQLIESYEEVLAGHRRLVRELDVLLNGEDDAAKQASLCDIVSQVRRGKIISEQVSWIPIWTDDLSKILREAAGIIRAISNCHEPDNMRNTIIDELEGFALMAEDAVGNIAKALGETE